MIPETAGLYSPGPIWFPVIGPAENLFERDPKLPWELDLETLSRDWSFPVK